ncbi:M50 family metallopeptidase [Raineyella sp. W15-4]|uniref:M50 family metallopeptidase n=1 Tax=Raineyella sp. W15-4 TaxID=3081651 RepID=UPI002955680B|nr:M50 family metallopeptidase [Raineyella sp. W15-4]WOQ16736.1 M50 family metallopeptidase [Raineyella sp. W15-4]
MDTFTAILHRALVAQPLPAPEIVLGLGAAALVLVLFRPVWRTTRMLVTITHEAGHAVVGRLSGRELEGIRLNADTSGVTVTRGRPRGPGMVATLLAGYTAPAVVGVAAAALLGTGRATALLWAFLLFLALMLLAIRNLYGLAVIMVVGGALGLATWYLPVELQGWLAYLLCWVLLFGAVRPTLELAGSRDRGSDAAQLARLTHLPQLLWTGLFLVVALVGLGLGGWMLLGAAGVVPPLMPLGSAA